jgi:hypothetical protein
MTRDGTFKFFERDLRRSIYGFRRSSSSSAASSSSGIEKFCDQRVDRRGRYRKTLLATGNVERVIVDIVLDRSRRR